MSSPVFDGERYLASQGHHPVRERAGRLHYRCPLHDERTPSFFLTPRHLLRSAQFDQWHCWGSCATHGGLPDLIMQMEGCTLIEAFDVIYGGAHNNPARSSSLSLPSLAPRATPKKPYVPPPPLRPTAYEQQVLTEVTQFWHEQLQAANQPARSAYRYQLQRGLSHPILALPHFGYVPGDPNGEGATFLLQRLLTRFGPDVTDVCLRLGVITERPRGFRLRGQYRVMFSCQDTHGLTQFFQGRILPLYACEDTPKYLGACTLAKYPFWLPIKELYRREMISTESPYGPAILARYGIRAQAHLGNGMHSERFFENITENDIWLGDDNDAAGDRQATLWAQEAYTRSIQPYRLRSPHNDIDSWVQQKGIIPILAALDNPIKEWV